MKWMRETTEWEDGLDCNHLYLLEGDRAYAYVKAGTNEEMVFSKPLQLDLRGRKFEFVKDFEVPTKDSSIVVVKGSKGETYEVNTEEQTCTCPGFRFRGSCRHVAELQQA